MIWEGITFIEQDGFSDWLNSRLDPDAKPKHKLVSRSLCLSKGPTLTIHTAGQPVLWQIPIRVAANDIALLQEMDEEDADLIRWVFKHDFTVQNYHYEI